MSSVTLKATLAQRDELVGALQEKVRGLTRTAAARLTAIESSRQEIARLRDELSKFQLRTSDKKGAFLTPAGELKYATSYADTRASMRSVDHIVKTVTGTTSGAARSVLRACRRVEMTMRLRDQATMRRVLPA